MTLYHYTSGQGLSGIFDSKELHCSNVNFLNDPSEQSYVYDLTWDKWDDLYYKHLEKYGSGRGRTSQTIRLLNSLKKKNLKLSSLYQGTRPDRQL